MRTDTIEQQRTRHPSTDQPATILHEQRHSQETSHVFYCMQCDLHFQMDIAVLNREASTERDNGMVRVRLDPRIKPEHEASSLSPACEKSGFTRSH